MREFFGLVVNQVDEENKTSEIEVLLHQVRSLSDCTITKEGSTFAEKGTTITYFNGDKIFVVENRDSLKKRMAQYGIWKVV